MTKIYEFARDAIWFLRRKNTIFETFHSSIIKYDGWKQRQAVSNNSLPWHRSASFNRSFAIELGLLIYVHCYAMLMWDQNIRSFQCTVMCPLCTRSLTLSSSFSTSYHHHRLQCHTLYTAAIVIRWALFSTRIKKTHTHTHRTLHYTSRSR